MYLLNADVKVIPLCVYDCYRLNCLIFTEFSVALFVLSTKLLVVLNKRYLYLLNVIYKCCFFNMEFIGSDECSRLKYNVNPSHFAQNKS